ncbi:MAG: hypothetical protein ABIK28_08150, partial [Planctomycetota bacterium]
QSGRYLAYLCITGRLKAVSKEMKELSNTMQNAETQKFNELVASLCRCNGETIVRKNVWKVAGNRLEVSGQ